MSLLKITKEFAERACEGYFLVKRLNEVMELNHARKTVMVEGITEVIGCYCLGLLQNKGDVSGDATDPVTNEKVEFKATCNFNSDATVFGHSCKFDRFVFIRFNLDEDLVYIYDTKMNTNDLLNVQVTKTETFGDKIAKKQKPHLSVIKKIIEARNLKPTVVFDLKKCEIK